MYGRPTPLILRLTTGRLLLALLRLLCLLQTELEIQPGTEEYLDFQPVLLAPPPALAMNQLLVRALMASLS
jgi:hypothetical protein